MGYPRRSDMYIRAFDPRLPPGERAASYDVWDRALAISGYYPHGGTLDTIALTPLDNPPPTLSTLSQEDRAKMTFKTDGDLDSRIMLTGIQTGFFATVRERALLVPGDEDVVGDAWRDVEARFVWGARSLPEVCHAMLTLRAEVDGAKEKGLPLRKIKLVTVKDGNHFVSASLDRLSRRSFTSYPRFIGITRKRPCGLCSEKMTWCNEDRKKPLQPIA